MPIVNISGMVQPRNPNNPTRAEFENAVDLAITTDALSELLPSGVPNTYIPGPRTPDGGFKYEWSDATPTRWTVWGHGPDNAAENATTASSEWTLRVKAGNRFLTYMSIGTGPGRVSLPATRWVNGAHAQYTHILLIP